MEKVIIKSLIDIIKDDKAFSDISLRFDTSLNFKYNNLYYYIYFVYVKGLRYIISKGSGPIFISKDYDKTTNPDKIASDIYKNIVK